MLLNFSKFAFSQDLLIWKIEKKEKIAWIVGVSHTALAEDALIPPALEKLYSTTTVVINESIIYSNQKIPELPKIAPKAEFAAKQIVLNLLNENLIEQNAAERLLNGSIEEFQYDLDMFLSKVRFKSVKYSYVEGFDYQLMRRAIKNKKPIDTLEDRWRARDIWRENCGKESDRTKWIIAIDHFLRNQPDLEFLNYEVQKSIYYGDLEKSTLLEERISKVHLPVAEVFRCSANTRTREWVDKFKVLQEKYEKPLFLIGASHLNQRLEENNLLYLLKKGGYSITRVLASEIN